MLRPYDYISNFKFRLTDKEMLKVKDIIKAIAIEKSENEKPEAQKVEINTAGKE